MTSRCPERSKKGTAVKIETALLQDGLAFVKAALRSHAGALDILKHLRFRVADGELILTACDLVAELEWRAQVDDQDDIDVCIPGARLLAIAGAAASEIEFKPGKGGISISSGVGRFRLPTLPGSDMPTMKTEDSALAEGDWTEIAREVDFADFCAPKDDTRGWIKGVNVRASGTAVEVTATDGTGIVQGALEQSAPGLDVTIPVGYTAMASHEALTRFRLFPQLLILSGDHCSAKIAAVSEKFPDVARVLKAERKTVVKVKRAELLHALELVDIIGDASVVTFDANGKSVKISLANHTETADADCPAAGGEVSFGMKIRWLLDIAKRADEEIELYWGGDPKKETMFCKAGRRLMGAMPYRI